MVYRNLGKREFMGNFYNLHQMSPGRREPFPDPKNNEYSLNGVI